MNANKLPSIPVRLRVRGARIEVLAKEDQIATRRVDRQGNMISVIGLNASHHRQTETIYLQMQAEKYLKSRIDGYIYQM